MTFETRPYDLDVKVFFRLALRNYFVSQGWGYVAAGLAVIIFSIVTGRDLTAILLLTLMAVVVLVGVPIFLVWRYARQPAHQVFFGRRRCAFGPDGMTFSGDRGTLARVPWLDLLYVTRTGSYYLFFTDKTQFYYVPFEAFKNPADLEKIDQFLKQKKFI
ncbi:MAG: YcxB family protein [Anaerolineae bacterium]|nr:YcxB family protein [Anaerolineae bacterium]